VTSKTLVNLNFQTPAESLYYSVNQNTSQIMPSGIAQKAKAVLKERCPDLALSAHATASNAIHDTNFVGTLHPWTNFEVDVEDSCATFDWTQLGQVLSHKPKGDPGAAYLSHEHIVCDNATSVRNRFQNNVGQVISAALRATGQSLAFGDYKASLGSPGLSQIVPDVVGIFTIQGSLRVVGEVKTPWVEDHDLELQSSTTTSFRHRLGEQTQSACYSNQS
jgi:hypothetical protein